MDDTLQQLATALQADEGLHAYVLIDPLWGDPLDRTLAEDEGCTLAPIKQPVPPAPAWDETSWPYLVAWRPFATLTLEASYRAALAEQADPAHDPLHGFAIGGWLLSRHDAPVLARHLGHIAVLRPPTRYARWSDRRVLEWLWPALDEARQASLLGPVEAWWTLDRCGQLVSRRADAAAREAASPHGAHPLLVDDAVIRQLDGFRHGQYLIDAWLRTAPEPGHYLHHVMQLLADARALGVGRLANLLLFAAYAAQLHPRIGRHPRVIEAVRQAAQGQRTLAEALAALDDPDSVARIRHELSHGFDALPPRAAQHGG